MIENPLALESILKAMDLDEPIIPVIEKLLSGGAYKVDLDQLVADCLGLESSHPRVEIVRMNLIAQLRGLGYNVTGGMRGRSLPYEITGWSEPYRDPPVSQWSPEARTILEKYTSLPELSKHDWGNVREKLSKRDSTSVVHENTWMYYWAYEASGHQGNRERLFILDGQSGSVIIGRKFANVPRLRVLQLDMNPDELYEIALELAQISLRPVLIKNLVFDDFERIRELDPDGATLVSRQQWYDVEKIANSPREFLSHGSWHSARKAGRDLEIADIEWDNFAATEYGKTVTQRWKDERESTQRQLAVGRDFVCAETLIPPKISFLGIRNGYPVGYYVYETLANRPDVAGHLVEKVLNWKDDNGGMPGTSDWMLHEICKKMTEKGVKWINAGESSEVSTTLHKYKLKFSVREMEPRQRTRVLGTLIQGRRAR